MYKSNKKYKCHKSNIQLDGHKYILCQNSEVKKNTYCIPLTENYKWTKKCLALLRDEQGCSESTEKSRWRTNTNLRTVLILERGKQWNWASICISNWEKWVSKKEASRVLCRHPVNQERGAWSEAVNRKESKSILEVHQRRSSDVSQTKTSSIKAGGCATPLALHSRSPLPFLLNQADTTRRRIQTHFMLPKKSVSIFDLTYDLSCNNSFLPL